MDRLHHEICWAGMYSILEVLPPGIPVDSSEDGVAIGIYRRLRDLLEAYDAAVGTQQHRFDPSKN